MFIKLFKVTTDLFSKGPVYCKNTKTFVHELDTGRIPSIGEILCFESDSKCYKVTAVVRHINVLGDEEYAWIVEETENPGVFDFDEVN